MNRSSSISSIILLLACVGFSYAQAGTITNPVNNEVFASSSTIAVLGSVTPAQTNAEYQCVLKLIGRTGQTIDSYGFVVTSDDDFDPISFSHNFEPTDSGWPTENCTIKRYVTDMEHEVASVRISVQ